MRLIDADALKEILKTDCSWELFDDWGNYKPEGKAIMDAIDSCPSVDPEPQWIPCSERLPEINKEILFCDFDGDIYVGYRNKWRWWDSMYDVKDVVAWMPLPEPWKGEE